MARKNNSSRPPSTRRDFLWKNACAAMTLTGIATTIRDLRLINAAAADTIRARPRGLTVKGGTTASNYKALVCIFLFGGNDGNNLLVPTDAATYSQYSSVRGAWRWPTPGKPMAFCPSIH